MAGPTKGRADFLELGSWNVACSMCGRKRKANQMERNWQGLYRCPEHNEPRQPQDFVRGVKDDPSVPFAQPELDQFVDTGRCNIYQMVAYAGIGVAGCMVAGRLLPLPLTIPAE
jgi:hypothetical protein